MHRSQSRSPVTQVSGPSGVENKRAFPSGSPFSLSLPGSEASRSPQEDRELAPRALGAIKDNSSDLCEIALQFQRAVQGQGVPKAEPDLPTVQLLSTTVPL